MKYCAECHHLIALPHSATAISMKLVCKRLCKISMVTGEHEEDVHGYRMHLDPERERQSTQDEACGESARHFMPKI